jgi:hypothetical protein
MEQLIHRKSILKSIQQALTRSRVVLLAGPRQSGKTTLARELLPENSPNYFDLEDPTSLQRLEEPMTALSPLRGLIVIDEVQRRADLFPVIRVLADRKQDSKRFLILGSASGELLRQNSESLAGRIERIEISGFSLSELKEEVNLSAQFAEGTGFEDGSAYGQGLGGGASFENGDGYGGGFGAGAGFEDGSSEGIGNWDGNGYWNFFKERLWLRGGFPLSYLADSEKDSLIWRKNFIQTLLERDFPQWGVRIPSSTLHRFWSMLANYHGQTLNISELASALGVSQPSIRSYLDLLSDAFMIRQLTPYHANLRKRQVKAPKLYIRDTGLLHQLVGIDSLKALLTHSKVGASWEGFVIEQILANEEYDEAFFWATHQGAEIDLILRKGDKFFGIECKRKDAPKITPSMKNALADLGLESIHVIYPGNKAYPIAENIQATPLKALAEGSVLSKN